jgi:putative glutamine amidotransferase
MKDNQGMLPGLTRSYVNEPYITAVANNNGVPFIIPITSNEEAIKAQVSMLDGLILSGGDDLSPFLYGEEPEQLLEATAPERDTFDILVLKYAMECNIPILGICRGAQLINVYHGGSLYQDNSYREGKTLKHKQPNNPSLGTHHVSLDKNSKLYSIYQQDEICVNSFHHQSVKAVGKGLVVVGQSSDGVVEAVESIEYPFMIALQWHPEMMAGEDEGSNHLFKTFIEKAKEMRNRCTRQNWDLYP